MLRITTNDCGSTTVLRLEGKLLGPWVDELQEHLSHLTVSGPQLILELATLTFADNRGAQLLTHIVRQGARINSCSGYLAALLHLEKA